VRTLAGKAENAGNVIHCRVFLTTLVTSATGISHTLKNQLLWYVVWVAVDQFEILMEKWRTNMSQRKALVVDDEIHIVQVVAIKLRNNGFDVITAENGAIALECVKADKPDIIVTDFQMPVMSGLELIENLRSDPETADIPVIMLTARGFAIEDEKKQLLNIADCLSKPFSPREVLACIEETLTTCSID